MQGQDIIEILLIGYYGDLNKPFDLKMFVEDEAWEGCEADKSEYPVIRINIRRPSELRV
jgi:hypothetical protein